jgi:hypothetical protein
LYNIIRIGDGPTAKREPVVRRQVYRNDEGLSYKYYELLSQMKEMHIFAQKGGEIYRNETKDCSWDCHLYDVCLTLTDVGEADSQIEKMKEKNI